MGIVKIGFWNTLNIHNMSQKSEIDIDIIEIEKMDVIPGYKTIDEFTKVS